MHGTECNQGQGDIKIIVNRREVAIAGGEATGAMIKEAARSAGLAIKSGFVLFCVVEGELHAVRDDETVRVELNLRFRCVAPDDNS